MSRLFNATTDRITIGTYQPTNPGSVAFFVYPTWAQADNADHVFLDAWHSPLLQIFRCQKYLDNKLYFGWDNNGVDNRVAVASASYTLNQSSWNSFLLTWDSNGKNSVLYLNGTSIGSLVGSDGAVFSVDQNTTLGNYVSGQGGGSTGVNLASRLSAVTFWNAQLGQTEADQLAAFVYPGMVRADALSFGPMMLWGDSSPEPNDTGGTEGTIASGTSQEENPNLIMPRSRALLAPASYVRGAMMIGVDGSV